MIQINNLYKSFLSQDLFINANFKLNAGNRVGLVGRNGSGKSTLFKMILDEEHPDKGDIIIPKNYRLATLKQHLSFSKPTVKEEVALALQGEAQYDLYKAEKILFGLGFTQEDLDKDPLSFSGGYQIRINLAKVLVTEPNLLLLDEPTNYLDILSLRWLKNFLRSFMGEVILITHDRDFMDGVCTHTMGVVRKQLTIIEGNTHKFYKQLSANDELHDKQKIAQDKKVKELEEFIAKNKARASTAALAQSKVKQLEKMELLDDLSQEATLNFDFNLKNTPSKVLLDVQNLSFGYKPETILFKDINFTLQKGECLAIIGKNGKGKSTLLNTIAGELTQLQGDVNFHTTASMAHFGQTNISHLNPKSTVMDEVYLGNPKLGEAQIRSICGAMMFSGDRAKKEIKLLSGGEKSRVMLGQIIARDVNLLFLDEPTNHLDMQSIAALTQAIQNFEGGVIIVTHSEAMLRAVADRLIIFTNHGAQYFDGGYDDFLAKIGWEDEVDSTKEKSTPKVNKKENKKQRAVLVQERSKKTNPLKKEVEKQEHFIMQTEEELELDHQELIDASNMGDTSKIMEYSKIVSTKEQAIESAFEKLDIAQTKLDTVLAEYEEKLQLL